MAEAMNAGHHARKWTLVATQQAGHVVGAYSRKEIDRIEMARALPLSEVEAVMKHKTAFVSTALLAVLTLGSATAFADDQGRRGHQGGQREGSARPHGNPSDNRAVPRAHAAPRVDHVAPRGVRPYAGRPYVGHVYGARPYGGRPYLARPYYHPYRVAPYYSGAYFFRPHTRMSFGIFLGYPVPYFAYPYPVPVYGYEAPPAPVVMGPTSTQYGGVSLEITPADASVYVDGDYAGLAGDFDGTRQPLTMTDGRHHLEIDAPGYQPWTFDVDVNPGQVVPYRGDLQPVQ